MRRIVFKAREVLPGRSTERGVLLLSGWPWMWDLQQPAADLAAYVDQQ